MSGPKPVVSVIMAVYNSSAYIEKAIESIMQQSFHNWELLVIDDASSDNSREIARNYATQDERIKLIEKKENSGVVDTRNLGIEASLGKYIAILDSDDIAYSERLELQYKFLESNPDHVLVGAACWEIDSNGKKIKKVDRTIPDHLLSSLLLFSNYFINSTVMIRKKALEQPAYNTALKLSEDYDQFCRLSKKGSLANLNRPLVYYRIHDRNISRNPEEMKLANKVIQKGLLKELGISATDEELSLHSSLTEGPYPTNLEELEKLDQWLLKIKSQNEIHGVYQKQSLTKIIRLFFRRSCVHSGLGLKAIKLFLRSKASGSFWSDPLENLIFIVKTAYYAFGIS